MRGSHFHCRDCSWNIGVAIHKNKDVLTARLNVWKMVDDAHRDGFKWLACRKEMHIAPVPIFHIILGTSCATAYDIVGVGSHIGPGEYLSESVKLLALAGMFGKGRLM